MFTKSRIHPFTIITALVMIAGLFAGLVLTRGKQLTRSKATYTSPELFLVPAQKPLALNESASFAVTIDSHGKLVSVAKLELSYDTSALKNVTFTPGTILPVQLPANNLSIANGKIKITLGVQPGSPFTGTGILGTLSVTAKEEKNSEIEFVTENDKTIILTTQTGSNNALAAATGASISAPGTTPNPTATLPPATPTVKKTPTPTPVTGAKLDCNVCLQKLTKPPMIINCINVCKDINKHVKQCPSACNITIPNAKKGYNDIWKEECLNALCR